jgi:hypothetical protein
MSRRSGGAEKGGTISAGQASGTGAWTELQDDVRKNDILSNRDNAQRPPGQGLDGKGV